MCVKRKATKTMLVAKSPAPQQSTISGDTVEPLVQGEFRFILLSAQQPGEVTSGAWGSCLKAGKHTETFQHFY